MNYRKKLVNNSFNDYRLLEDILEEIRKTEIIKSKENKFFKRIKKLKTKKYRDKEELFIAEGHKFLDFKEAPEYIVVREDCDRYDEKIAAFQCEKYIFSEPLFNEITTQENSQGVILVYKMTHGGMEALEDNIVVLDRVQDPGNLGTIIRVADAAGYRDIILTKGSVDVYNDKCVRSSMGSLFNMNILYVEGEKLLEELRERGYKISVTALASDAVSYTQMELDEKNAIIFGNEGQGVSKEIIDAADQKVIIPIYGSAESLNVAMASGIMLYKCRELLG